MEGWRNSPAAHCEGLANMVENVNGTVAQWHGSTILSLGAMAGTIAYEYNSRDTQIYT